MSAHSKREFELIRDEWYIKLKESGFVDIENIQYVDGSLRLRKFDSFDLNKREKRQKVVDVTQYYYKAKELLNSYPFKSDLEKKIWSLHCSGLSQRKIEKAIENDHDAVKRQWIQNIINLIAREIK